jgi:hypothetical protein
MVVDSLLLSQPFQQIIYVQQVSKIVYLWAVWQRACISLRREPQMLRISTIEEAGETVKLRIDGQVSGQWVKLLQKTCEGHLERGLQLTIDLRNVSFVDRDGIALLGKLTDCGVEFVNASPFIAEQLMKRTV